MSISIDKKVDETKVAATEVNPSIKVAKIWSENICGTILCLAGLGGYAIGIESGPGWLIFIGAMLLL